MLTAFADTTGLPFFGKSAEQNKNETDGADYDLTAGMTSDLDDGVDFANESPIREVVMTYSAFQNLVQTIANREVHLEQAEYYAGQAMFHAVIGYGLFAVVSLAWLMAHVTR